MKHCKRCGETDQTKFYKTGIYCRVCHREWVRDYRLKKLGITREQYLAVLHGQLGGCAACGNQEQPIGNGHRGLHQDHDKATGKARGVLCSRCNQVLGRVDDSVGLLRALIDYVLKYQA